MDCKTSTHALVN